MTQRLIFIGGAARTGTTLCQGLVCGLNNTSSALPESAQLLVLNKFISDLETHNQRFDHAFWSRPRQDQLFGKFLDVLLAEMASEIEGDMLVLKSPAATPLLPKIAAQVGDRGNFLIVVRDPRDAIASMIMWANRAAENGKHIWFSSRNIPQLCEYFLSFYGPVLHEQTLFGPANFVRYEDLVAAPDAALAPFIAAQNLTPYLPKTSLQPDWGTLDLTPGGPVGASASPLYGQGVQVSQIGAHRTILTDVEIRQIEELCQVFMDHFAYDYKPFKSRKSQALQLAKYGSVISPIQPTVRPDMQEARNAVAEEMDKLRVKIAQQKATIDSVTKQRTAAKKSATQTRTKLTQMTAQKDALGGRIEELVAARDEAVGQKAAAAKAASDKVASLKSALDEATQTKVKLLERSKVLSAKLDEVSAQKNVLKSKVAELRQRESAAAAKQGTTQAV